MGHFHEERVAIEGALSDAWSGESVPLKWENDKTATPSAAPFVTVTIITGDGEFASLGSTPRRRYQGSVAIRIYVPEGLGNREASRLVELAESAFLTDNGVGKQIQCGANGLITFRVPSREASGIAGGFYTANLRAPFYRDQQGA